VGEVAERSAAGEGAATKSTFRMPHPHPALRADLSREAGEVIIGGGPRRDESIFPPSGIKSRIGQCVFTGVRPRYRNSWVLPGRADSRRVAAAGHPISPATHRNKPMFARSFQVAKMNKPASTAMPARKLYSCARLGNGLPITASTA
jgi:hypothetical protein